MLFESWYKKYKSDPFNHKSESYFCTANYISQNIIHDPSRKEIWKEKIKTYDATELHCMNIWSKTWSNILEFEINRWILEFSVRNQI